MKIPYAIYIYTDSSKAPYSNDLGIAFVVVHPKKHKIIFEYFRKFKNYTNNQGELLAIYYSLCFIYKHKPKMAFIYSDSQYAINVLNGKYKPKKNIHIINKISKVLNKCKEFCIIELAWVKAHNGNKFNERADFLANIARNSKHKRKR